MKKHYKNFKKPEVVRQPYSEKFPPSKEQAAVHEMVRDTSVNVHVGAVAGSGKTTTVCASAHKAGRANASYLAFSKTIVEEVEPKMPDWMTVKTGHAFGLSAFAGRKPYINKYKVGAIIKDLFPAWNPDEIDREDDPMAFSRFMELQRLIKFVKVTMIDPKDKSALMRACFQYNIDLDELDEVCSMVPKIIDANNNLLDNIDFDDMLYLPVQLNFKLRQFDLGYVDECQDLSPVMMELTKRMFNRVVTVGDEFQAIMGFAGADCRSIPNLVKHFGSTSLPLNTCYRCGHKIIERAQKLVPHIVAFENNADGIVNELDKVDWTKVPDHMVLSRRNSTLVKPCFAALKAGRKAMIKGQDIGEQLIKLSKQIKGDTLTQFHVNLEGYKERKLELLLNRKAQASSIEFLNDQVDVLKSFADECITVGEIAPRIKDMFKDDTKGLVFSSMHRSKGLECDEVTILDYGNVEMNRPNMSEDEIQQEKNLHYVGLTRAKKVLNLVTK